jgi:hypothetical protein
MSENYLAIISLPVPGAGFEPSTLGSLVEYTTTVLLAMTVESSLSKINLRFKLNVTVPSVEFERNFN